MGSYCTFLSLALLTFAWTGTVGAQSDWSQEAKLNDDELSPSPSAGFGSSIATGQFPTIPPAQPIRVIALIGAPDDDFAAPGAGAVYKLDRNPHNGIWGTQIRFVPPEPELGGAYGTGAAIEPGGMGTLHSTLISDPEFDGTGGISFPIFPPNDAEWLQPSTNDGAGFGTSFAIYEDTLVVGAPGDDEAGSSAGAVFVYEPGSTQAGDWNLVQKLTASDPQAGARFGHSLALLGNRLIVGSPMAGNPMNEAGVAYVFEKGAMWTEVDRIEPPSPQEEAHFGTSVAIGCGIAVVGEPDFSDAGGASRGAAHVFNRGASWVHSQTLLATEGASDDDFGTSVAVVNSAIAVGDPSADAPGQASGAVYIFEPVVSGVWTQTQRLVGDGTAGDAFGYALSLTSDIRQQVIVGAPGDDDQGVDAGSAYVFVSTLVRGDGFECGDTDGWTLTVGGT